MPDPEASGGFSLGNYIRWLLAADSGDIKSNLLVNLDDERQPTPKALLYRMLRHALLLSYHDTTMQIYANNGVVEPVASREVELPNV